MSYNNNGAIPPLIQSDAIVSGVLSTSGLNEYLGTSSFLGPVTIVSTTPVVIDDTLVVSALTVSGTTKLGTAAGASVSIGTTSASLLSFYGKTPLSLQPTAAASATVSGLVTGTVSNCVSSSTTFNNYTIQQLVTALQQTGIIA